MRTVEDALRSVKKYLALVLSPQPSLNELWWTNGVTTLRYTTNHWVEGCVDVDLNAWSYLRHQDRQPPVVSGSAPALWLKSQLVGDPRPGAAAAGVSLAGSTLVDMALPLEPEWEVRLAADPGEYVAPFAVVSLVPTSGSLGGALYYERTQPFQIDCYPEFSSDESVEDAVLRGTRVMDALERGFRREGVDKGRPLRIPLYDYAGVGSDETATARHAADYLVIRDFQMRDLPDLDEPRRRRLVVDLRLSWLIQVDLTALKDRNDNSVRGTRTVASVTEEFDGS